MSTTTPERPQRRIPVREANRHLMRWRAMWSWPLHLKVPSRQDRRWAAGQNDHEAARQLLLDRYEAAAAR